MASIFGICSNCRARIFHRPEGEAPSSAVRLADDAGPDRIIVIVRCDRCGRAVVLTDTTTLDVAQAVIDWMPLDGPGHPMGPRPDGKGVPFLLR